MTHTAAVIAGAQELEQLDKRIDMTPDIGNNHISITAVGSRVTCNPSPTGTDQDWLVLVDQLHWADFHQGLFDKNWELGGSLTFDEKFAIPDSERFSSFTLGENNIIATDSEEFHRRFLAATSVAKHLNLLNKADRIALFQAVLYGNQFSADAA